MVLPVATGARQVAHINDASIRLNGEAGLLSFGCMHPDAENAPEELRRLADAGIRGVKLHPPYQGADFDDPRYLRILDACGELGLIAVTHAGLDVGLPGHEEAVPEKIARALERVGPVKLVLAHMGGWRCWEAAEALLAGTDAMLDTSFSLGAMTPLGDGYERTEEELQLLSQEAFLRMVRAFGARRILFGTDSPWGDQAAEKERIKALPLTEEEKTAILGGNARRLLGI